MGDIKIFTNNIEELAKEQIKELDETEIFKNKKIRIMPDVHSGKGCVIGFTAELPEKVIPNLVGVDIGCGMLTVGLGQIELKLEKLDKIIKRDVPSGKSSHINKIEDFNDIKKLKCLSHLKNIQNFEKSLGSLGGGRHDCLHIG